MISEALSLGTELVKRVFPDKTEQLTAQLRLTELAQKGDSEQLNAEVALLLGQLDINKTEAASDSVFVAGWRPFIGWCCGAAIFWQFVAFPIVRFFMQAYDIELALSAGDNQYLFELILGMLGLSGLRTFEKIKR